jgi:hypothetical protein
MSANSFPPAIFLMGPTASGKTALAVSLVERFPLEIISVDSALVYRDMNIGTAKPDAATLARAPHHLLDIRDPTESYSAAAFCEDARRLMADIVARGKVPLLAPCCISVRCCRGSMICRVPIRRCGKRWKKKQQIAAGRRCTANWR